MDAAYIGRNKPDDDDDLDYEESKKMCADKGTSKHDNFIIESYINKSYSTHA